MRQHRGVELGHGPGPLPHALGVDAAFDAVLEEHLHPDADPEHRQPAGQTALDELVAAARAERVHDRAERADSRDHETGGVLDETAIARQARVGAGGREGLDRRVDVAGAVIEDSDQGGVGHRAPFVLGMPRTCGSRALACRNARANALYSASAMWCGSRPPSTVMCIVSAALYAMASKV